MQIKVSGFFVSIHAPRAGGDGVCRSNPGNVSKFQSTPPAQGATPVVLEEQARLKVSIHAPRAGGDEGKELSRRFFFQFQSTPPAQGATRLCRLWCRPGRCFNPRPPRRGRRLGPAPAARREQVSIHAPRAGGDGRMADRETRTLSFNPRPPRRGRPYTHQSALLATLFQSTPPAQGATLSSIATRHIFSVSIHAPRAGGDPLSLI